VKGRVVKRTAAIVALLLGGFTVVQAAEDAPSDPGKAKAVYARNCALCHGANGGGGVGVSLKKLAERRSDAEIEAQIKEPKGAMPKLYPNAVTDADLHGLVDYLKSF